MHGNPTLPIWAVLAVGVFHTLVHDRFEVLSGVFVALVGIYALLSAVHAGVR
jgi:hypothetical protein